MLTQKYNSVRKTRIRNRSRRITEATATERLQTHFYAGVGPKYLGWRFAEYRVLPNGTEQECEPAGSRSWKTPPETDRYKWNPLLEHLRGCNRGLVAKGATHVPFVSVDLDRHSGDIRAEDHICEVMHTGRLLATEFSHIGKWTLRWCIEVNPRNGSAKFFGFSNHPVPLVTAEKIGGRVHEAMREKGIFGSKDRREVFPFNHSQVLLPMRRDKITIVDTGILPSCTRKQRILVDYDSGVYKMMPYATYSVLAFTRWIRSGGHYSERTLYQELKKACASLPDKPVVVPAVVVEEKVPSESTPARTHSWHHSGKGKDNPNSFERQHEALLEFCRRLGRVTTQQEALDYIRSNRLFTESWEDNKARPPRVKWILRYIAKTFDPAKCRGVRHEVPIGKYDNWAIHHVGTIRGQGRKIVDEYGDVHVRENRYTIDRRFVSTFLSIVEYCLIISPNEDGSLPQARAEDIWNRCYEGGQTQMPFSQKKWAICRDWLEKQGVIKVVDRDWHRGKAMRWKVLDLFFRLPVWWRREKRPALLEAVGLEEFLEGLNGGTQPLNSYTPQGVPEKSLGGAAESDYVRPPP